MILEATAEDVIKVADTETKVVEEGEAKEVTESNAAKPDSKVKPFRAVTAQTNLLRSRSTTL